MSIARRQFVLGLAATTAAVGTFGITNTATAAAGDLLERIKADGVFTVGTEARFPPFEFVENGIIVGYSADIMDHIMQALPGVKLNRLDLPFQGILPGLQAKKFDYVVTSIVVNKKRHESYALSLPIADATLTVVKLRKDDSIKSPADMGGKIVGTQAGSANLAGLEIYAEELAAAGNPITEIKTYTGFDEAYADLAAGRIQAVVNNLPNALELQLTRPDMFEVLLETFGPKLYFSWAGRKDEDSASLVAFIDEQLRALNESGVLNQLQEKWLGAAVDLPSDSLPEPLE